MLRQNKRHENVYECVTCGAVFMEYVSSEAGSEECKGSICPFCGAELESEVENGT